MSVNDRLIKSELARHEAVIERGMKTTIEVGMSMAAIRDEKLYEGAFKTFEEYIKNRWGFERAHAYRLIDAAGVAKNLSPIGDKIEIPSSESQLREIGKAPPGKQAEVVKKAAEKAAEENRKPTAKDYKQVVAELVWEDVGEEEEDDEEEEPAKPALSKEEQIKAERKKARSYAEYLQRSVDDLNHIKRNPTLHPELIKLCGQILGGLEKW